eukprot:741296-Pyramimonas_sp.AAC.1
MALALAPRAFVIQMCNNFTDGGRVVSKCGSRLTATHSCLQRVPQFYEWRAFPYQKGGSRFSSLHLRFKIRAQIQEF